MHVPPRLADLDTRRTRARLTAPGWFLGGVVVVALCNAALVVLALAAWVRLQSWRSGTVWQDSSVWRWLPGGVAVVVLVAAAVSAAYLVLHGFSAAPERVVQASGARPSTRAEFPQVHNVAEELAIGLGVTPPELFATDDTAPNVLSAHGLRRRVIVHTAGLAALPRAEIEAALAHEYGHLHAADARWVSAASVTLGNATRYAALLLVLAAAVLGVFLLALQYGDTLLVSWFVAAALLAAVGSFAIRLLTSAGRRVRRTADDVADVAAIRLARHPEALGQLLHRLEREPSTVAHSSWRTAILWFEELPAAGPDVQHEQARVAELRRRAQAAYATADRLPPAPGAAAPDPAPSTAAPRPSAAAAPLPSPGAAPLPSLPPLPQPSPQRPTGADR